MGCNCSRESKTIVSQKIAQDNKNIYIIKVHIPTEDIIKVILYEGKKDYMLLTDILNKTLFLGEHSELLDANFISKYNAAKDEFEYYIQRLAGEVIENEEEPNRGKVWVTYINKIKYNWSYLCSNNRAVQRGDEIELKYEKYYE